MMTASTKPSRNPADDAARVEEITRLLAHDLAGATALAQAAKADGVIHPTVHHLIGIQLKQNGRFEEAILELGHGLRLAPENSRMMTLIGFCLLELDRRQEAAQVFGEAMKLDPGLADAAYGYGWSAEGLGALDAAESGYRRAVALEPRHADALAGLAGLAVRRRDWEIARTYAEQAVDLDPAQTDALTHLARIELGQRNFVAAERRLIDIIALPHLKPQARANARIMLGDALDGAKRYGEAFDAYAAGKAEMRDLFAPVHAQPGQAGAIEGVFEILAEFEATPRAAWTAAAPASRGAERGHAFLLGFPRSGTTLLEQVLATHPDVVTLEERPVLIDAEAEFLTLAGGVERLSGVVSALLEPYRQSYWRRVREFGVDVAGKVFVDKHPLNTFRLPLIAKVFPQPKVIFALRDPRDVVLSCFRRSFNMNTSMYAFTALEDTARLYDAVMRSGEVYCAELPLDVHRVRYEDVVADFEGAGRGLCDFLGVPWTAKLRDFAETAKAKHIATPSSAQVGRGLYDDGVGQWRNYAFALEPVLPILRPWIETFGYAAD